MEQKRDASWDATQRSKQNASSHYTLAANESTGLLSKHATSDSVHTLTIVDSHTLARAMLARHEERSTFEDERKLSRLRSEQSTALGATADPAALTSARNLRSGD